MCLSLLTSNLAKILGLENTLSKINISISTDFLVTDYISVLDITNHNNLFDIFISDKKLICIIYINYISFFYFNLY